MNDKIKSAEGKPPGVSRRSLIAGAGAGLSALAAGAAHGQQQRYGAGGEPVPADAPGGLAGAAGNAPPTARRQQTSPTDFTDGGLHFRSEASIHDCEVEGTIPADLAGAFYRVGPDPQYPFRYPENIAFDGEGHVGAFFFRNGHVDFKSRYPRTQRWLAQAEARRALFGMYRNPFTLDPALPEGTSAGTANTHIVVHHGKLLALKEDSPPVAMDPLTLETTDNYYLFGGDYAAPAHTAHPKIDPVTGEMIGFAYEAKGRGTEDIYLYSCDPAGKITWDAWVKAPFACMLHDFAVTQNHIGFLVIPMQVDMQRAREGGLPFSYDSNLPSYLGVMRRGGDGSDMMWLQGPPRMSTHTMGCWSEGDMFYFDMDMGESNQFPFFPNVHGEPFNPVSAGGYVARMTVDTSNREPRIYDIEYLYGQQFPGYLPRQDDRYLTLPYRYGFMPGTHPTAPGGPGARNSWVRFDHSTRTVQHAYAGPGMSVEEMCFVPRRPDSPEGDGYLIGMAHHGQERRSELLMFDTDGLDSDPIARVKLPWRVFGQVHGWWTPASQIPGWDDAAVF